MNEFLISSSFIFICVLCVPVASEISEIDKLVNSLFSVSCEDEVELYSEWTQCLWPHGDLRPVIINFTRDAKRKGCKIPPPSLIRRGLRELRKGNYSRHPLYKKIPKTECGFCGRKAQCCTKSRSFLTQSFRSDRCDGPSPPCVVQPLSSEELDQLRGLYPDVEPSSNGCDVNPFIARELGKLKRSPAYKFVRPLLCQILGTTTPSFSCVNTDGFCRCCCLGFKYEQNECVPDPEYQSDAECD